MTLDEILEYGDKPVQPPSIWGQAPKRAEAAGIAEGQGASTEQFAIYGRHASFYCTDGEQQAVSEYRGRHRTGFLKGLFR